MAVDLIAQLERALSSDSRLASLVGMEIAWILIGLAHASRPARAVERPLERVAEHLQRERRATSGLDDHDAASRFRRHLPNFATEIYTLLALATLARVTGRQEHASRRRFLPRTSSAFVYQMADGPGSSMPTAPSS